MKIKKHPNGNEYLLAASGHWVRNFTRAAPAVDINRFTDPKDYSLLIANQMGNLSNPKVMLLDKQTGFVPNAVVISDGYDFMVKRKLLEYLPANVVVIGVNRTLAKWDVGGKRAMTHYVMNNPYGEAMSYLPTEHRYYPNAIISVRSNPEFVKRYKGTVHAYAPVPEASFNAGLTSSMLHIDDYRNPVCAAIGLAYRLGVVRLLLLCCDDSFERERPGAERLPNGLFMYPQHRVAHSLIDANLFWLTNQEGKRRIVGHHCAGPDYDNAPYIQENGLSDFFTKEL